MKLLSIKILLATLVLLTLFLFYKQHVTKKRNTILENLVKQHELVYVLIGKEKSELIDIVSKDIWFKHYSLKEHDNTITLEYNKKDAGDFFGFYFFIDGSKITKIELFKP